jgi:hypothetical protein
MYILGQHNAFLAPEGAIVNLTKGLAVESGLGHIVALYYCSSALHRSHYDIRCIYF